MQSKPVRPFSQPDSSGLNSTGNLYAALVCALFSMTAVWMIWVATRWGIGLTPDSTVYIGVARNIVRKLGLVYPQGTPLTHYPPLYPLMLAGASVFGTDPLQSARWVHGFLFAANTGFLGYLFYRASGRSLIGWSLGSILFITSPVMLLIHARAWSEPLFIFWTLLSLIALAGFIETSRRSLLVFAAVFTALAFLTRYIGASLALAGAAAVFLFSRNPVFQRIRDAALFGAISVFPMVLWMIRNRLAAGTATNRALIIHPITWGHVEEMLTTLGAMMAPGWSPDPVQAGIFLAALCLLGAAFRLKHRKIQADDNFSSDLSAFPAAASVFLLCYLFLLMVSISFFDAHTPMDVRILSPVHVFGLCILVCLALQMRRAFRRPFFAIGVVAVVLGFSVAQVFVLKTDLRALYENGSFFASRRWQVSELMAGVRALPRKTLIYSNAPDALDILADRPAMMIPNLFNPGVRRTNPDFQQQIAGMMQELAQKDGVLVYANMIDWRWYLPTAEDLRKHLPLIPVYQGDDGFIFKAALSVEEDRNR